MKRGLNNKFGLSTIIVTLILIVISLAAIGVFWMIINNVIKGGSEQIGLDRFIVDAEIKNVGTDNVSNNVSLTFKRKAGSGDMTGIKFVFTDGFNTEMVSEEFTLKELEERRFTFHLSKLLVDNLLTISIVPMIKASDGKEIIGNTLGIYNVKKGNYEAGTTPTGNQTSCVPASCSGLGFDCGTWSNGTCGGSFICGSGTCSSGYYCASGHCTLNQTTCTPAVNPCGSAVCGTVTNGTCGNISCGTCSSGYNCVAGSCVLQISGEILSEDRQIDWENNIAFQTGIPNYPIGRNAITDCGADNTGVNDASTQIQNCLTALSGQRMAVYLPIGIYNIGTTLTIPPNVSLRGAGMMKTNISYTGSSAAIRMSYTGTARWTADRPIISGSTIGSTQITVGDVSGLIVGDVISIHEDEDGTFVDNRGCSWCGDEQGHYLGQFVEITSINGGVITFNRPLYYSYNLNPGFRKYYMPSGMGVENLSIDSTYSTSTKTGTILMRTIKNSWVKDVEISRSFGMPVWIDYSYANTVTGSYIHSSRYTGSDRGYGVWIFNLNSEHYIYNNIMDYVRYGVNFEGGGTGCIVAYNYIRNVREGDNPSWLHSGIGMHGSHPYMNLIEGNIMPTFISDYTWGSSSHNLIFRNLMTRESDINWTISLGIWNIDLENASTYYSFIGNVLGYSGMTGNYELLGCSGVTRPVYRFGCNSPGGTTYDNRSSNTAYRHGNYDYITQSTIWDTTVSNHNLPNSYYLSSKPSWFGSLAWPAIGPDLAPINSTIPAQQRFYNNL